MLTLFISVFSAGCAALPPDAASFGAYQTRRDLSDVPFYPQSQYQCGPAALLTLLDYAGATTSMEELVQQVYVPGRHGSLQAEMMAATRAAGRIPYRIDASLAAIAAELDAGRPVLVLQNLGVSWAPRWHYAVVAGIDPGARSLVLRSGIERRRVTQSTTFMRTWQRSDFWAFVALRPGELPANPDRGRYFDAIAGIETTGHLVEARAGWQAAVALWPADAIARFGVANTELALGNPAGAETWYRQVLATSPAMLAARNNLALSLARQGKFEEARREVELLLGIADQNDRLYSEFIATRDEIEAAANAHLETSRTNN